MNRIIRPKLYYLDGLRGIAALIVVLAHFKELVLPGTKWMTHFRFETVLENSPLMLLMASSLSVLIFFVHSGFVLSWKYLNGPDSRLLISMAARRGFRLGIPIAASVWFAFLLSRLGFMHNREVAAISGSSEFFSSFYEFYPSFTSALTDSLGGALVTGSVRYNGALWTMPIELFCSYLVFLVLPLVVKVRMNYLFIGCGVAAVSLLGNFHNVVCFIAGLLLVRMYQEGLLNAGSRIFRLFNSRVLAGMILAFLVVSIIYPAWVGSHVPLPVFLNPVKSLQVVCAIIVLLMVLTRSTIQRVLGNSFFKYLGRLSFSAYLVHLPILCSFSSWLFLKGVRGGLGYGLTILITLLATITVVYFAAWVMTLTFDEWAINLGKRTLEKYLYPEPERKRSDLSAPLQVGACLALVPSPNGERE